MNKFITLALAAGVTLSAVAPADAANGCGRGAHRGPYGHCRANNGPGYGARAPGLRLVIGNFYRGRGYWDGRRYYQHRDAYRGGYRYR